jgi:hypothetical protein
MHMAAATGAGGQVHAESVAEEPCRGGRAGAFAVALGLGLLVEGGLAPRDETARRAWDLGARGLLWGPLPGEF